MELKFKKLHESAVLPSYAKEGDAGMDLTAVSKESNGDILTYKFGLAVEVPKGYVGLMFPRSSVYKQDLIMSNCVGVVDSGYRGEIMAKYRLARNPDKTLETYNIGDRVAQLVVVPYASCAPAWAEELSSTERGEGAHGSTGN